MKILYNKDTLLLNRSRVSAVVEHPEKKTPSRSEIKKQVAKEFKTKEELVGIRHIYTKYGEGTSKIIAHIYNDEITKNKLEKPKKKDREAVKEQTEEGKT